MITVHKVSEPNPVGPTISAFSARPEALAQPGAMLPRAVKSMKRGPNPIQIRENPINGVSPVAIVHRPISIFIHN